MYQEIHGTDTGKGTSNPNPPDRETVISCAREFIRELLSLRLNLRKAILYGSFAKGEQRGDSDIDLALVADEFSGFGFEDRKYFARINIRKPYSNIQTITYGTEYFEKGDPFIEEIKKSGIVLYQASI